MLQDPNAASKREVEVLRKKLLSLEKTVKLLTKQLSIFSGITADLAKATREGFERIV